ncbi:helix-turn-helix transcriptional regulator [Citrobacter freundii]|nr:helix-turn-helix transcriptional regulator [Citrobacter freundii]
MKEISIPENKLIERLNELLKMKGTSKTELAKIAGVSPQSVNGWFKRGTISKLSAIRLAAHFDVPIAWIFGDDTPPTDNTEITTDEQRLLDAFRGLPPIERNNMLLAFETRLQELRNFYRSYTKPDNSGKN